MELEEKYNIYQLGKQKLAYKFFLFKLLYLIFLLTLACSLYYRKDFLNNKIKAHNNYCFYINYSSIYNYINNVEYFNVTNVKYYFNLQYNLIKIEYNIGFYDKYNNLILPSDLTLKYNLHIICSIEIDFGNSINSLANIYENKYFKCIEFFNLNDKIKFWIKIYQIKENGNLVASSFYIFNENIFKLSDLIYQNNNLFCPLIINENYDSLIKKINGKNLKTNRKLKKSYLHYPYCVLKKDSIFFNDKWIFKNIYNEFFCFCKGNKCLNTNTVDSCKFPFYLNIIDKNRNVYPKTEYLFFDFIFADLSSDDVYPVFKKMYNLKYPVHYITEKQDIL